MNATNNPLLIPALGLTAGIILGRYCPVTITTVLVLTAIGLLTAFAGRRKPLVQTAAIVIMTVTLGLTRISMPEMTTDGHSMLDGCRARALELREQLLTRYQAMDMPAEDYATVVALTLGDRRQLTAELKTAYRDSGASHVLALSGLHLGIIYAMMTLLTVGRRRHIITQTTIILALWAFAFMVGLPPSIVRAATMLTFYALFQLGYRNAMTLNVLAFTAIVMLCCDPLSLFTVSFQLSFLSVLGIILVYPALHCLLPPELLLRHTVLRWVWGMCCVSIGAQTGVAPLIAYYFGSLPLLFLLTNLLVLPAVTIILYLSLAALALPFAGLLPTALAIVVGLTNRALRYIATLPGATVSGLHVNLPQVLALYTATLAAILLLRLLTRHHRTSLA